MVDIQNQKLLRKAPPDFMNTVDSTTSELTTDSIVYHYTNADALIHIIRTGLLWATHLRYMNDPSEIDLGIASVKYALDNATEHEYNQERQLLAIRQAAQNWNEQVFESIDPIDDYFAVCFSTEGDSLSQWRAYGRRPGAGPGVSIGFRLDDLSHNTRTIEPVHYVRDASEGARFVRKWVSLLDPDIGPQPEHGTHGSPFNPERWLWWQKAQAAAFIKHEAFRDEHEVRCILKASAGHRSDSSTNDFRPAIRHRPSGYGMTPYVELEVKNAPPRRVIIGPCPHPELASASLRSFFETVPELTVPEICSSGIPFRDW